MLRAAAADAFVLPRQRGERGDRIRIVTAFERDEAARELRHVGAGRIAPIAGIAGKPGGEEVAAAIRIVALVADVRDTMRAMRVLPVEHHGSFDLRSRLRDTAVLAERDRVIGEEPVIVAVMRGETVEQLR